MPSKKIEGVSRKDISILTDPELIRVAEGFNHRKEFDEEKLAQLAESIRLHGLKVPLTSNARTSMPLRKQGSSSGSRRWASQTRRSP